MKVTKTYLDAFELRVIGSEYIKKKELDPDKIALALRKLMKQVNDHIDEYNSLIDDIQLDNCATYPDGPKKGSVIYEDGINDRGMKIRNRVFTPESEKIVKKAGKEILKNEIVFDSRIPENIDPEVIEKLSDQEVDCFSGLVIPSQLIDEK